MSVPSQLTDDLKQLKIVNQRILSDLDSINNQSNTSDHDINLLTSEQFESGFGTKKLLKPKLTDHLTTLLIYYNIYI